MRSRWLCAFAGLIVVASPGIAHADETAEALVQKGESLGKAGDYEGALAAFRKAERLSSRAIHDCWIALAQMRLRNWTSSQFHLDRCLARSGNAKPVAWFDFVAEQVASGSKSAGFVEVEIVSDPPGARVAVDRIADDEWTTPVTLRLAPGSIVTAGMRGRDPQTATVSDTARQRIALTLAGSGHPSGTSTVTAVRAARSRPTVPWVLIGVGGAAAVGGVVFHYQASSARSRAEDANDRAEYDDEIDRLVRDRTVAVGLYVVGAAAAGVGLYLLLAPDETDSTRISVAPSSGGGAVWLERTF